MDIRRVILSRLDVNFYCARRHFKSILFDVFPPRFRGVGATGQRVVCCLESVLRSSARRARHEYGIADVFRHVQSIPPSR